MFKQIHKESLVLRSNTVQVDTDLRNVKMYGLTSVCSAAGVG